MTEVSYTKHRKLLGACHRGDRQMGGMYKTFIKKKVHPPETSILVTASSMLLGNTCDLDQTTTLSASVFSPIRRRLALPICPGYRGNNGMPGKHFGKQEKYSSSGSFPPGGHLCETLGLCPLLARLLTGIFPLLLLQLPAHTQAAGGPLGGQACSKGAVAQMTGLPWAASSSPTPVPLDPGVWASRGKPAHNESPGPFPHGRSTEPALKREILKI